MSATHIIGVFDSKQDLLTGIEGAQRKNFVIDEIYTPYPVMEAIDALKRNRCIMRDEGKGEVWHINS